MSSDPMRTKVFSAIAENPKNAQEEIAESLKITPVETLLLTRWLVERDLVQERYGSTDSNYGHELTEKGEYVHRTGQSVEDALAGLYAPPVSNVTNAPTFHGGNVQFAHDNSGTMNQTNNITIDAGDLAPVLQVMREMGDTNTADVVERLNVSGDGKGALRLLVDRFTGKAVDAAATQTVTAAGNSEYASKILPAMMNLFSNLPWF